MTGRYGNGLSTGVPSCEQFIAAMNVTGSDNGTRVGRPTPIGGSSVILAGYVRAVSSGVQITGRITGRISSVHVMTPSCVALNSTVEPGTDVYPDGGSAMAVYILSCISSNVVLPSGLVDPLDTGPSASVMCTVQYGTALPSWSNTSTVTDTGLGGGGT